MPTPTDSRLGPGLLKLGGVDYGVQIANVELTPDQKSSDGTPTLGNPDPLPEVEETWTLKGSAIQDWEDAAGIVNYCFDNSLSVVAFEWTPNTDAATKWTGNVLLTALPIGGDVSAQNTSDFEWAVQGVPVRTDPPGAPEASSRELAARRARNRTSLAPGGTEEARPSRRRRVTTTRSSAPTPSAEG